MSPPGGESLKYSLQIIIWNEVSRPSSLFSDLLALLCNVSLFSFHEISFQSLYRQVWLACELRKIWFMMFRQEISTDRGNRNGLDGKMLLAAAAGEEYVHFHKFCHAHAHCKCVRLANKISCQITKQGPWEEGK